MNYVSHSNLLRCGVDISGHIVAGPDRPTPPSVPVQSSQKTGASDIPGLMKTMGDARNDVYQRLNNAVAERGCVNDHLVSFPR
jgi:hypothetical protein